MPVRIALTEQDRDACLAIRTTVFVEEQHVPIELELDSYDTVATHFLLTDDLSGLACGTARLYDKNGDAKIGRVAVLLAKRGQGLGQILMQAVLQYAQAQGFQTAVLDSQISAIQFYEKLGFVAEGDEFEDAGIAHVRMRRLL